MGIDQKNNKFKIQMSAIKALINFNFLLQKLVNTKAIDTGQRIMLLIYSHFLALLITDNF